MAKRAKVRPIKSSPKIQTENGVLHKCAMIKRGEYWDIKCHTCGMSCLCGGSDGDEMLKGWAAWHATKVEVHEVGKDSTEKVEVPWG